MKKFSLVFFALFFTLLMVVLFTGCPSKPSKFSDPDKAKANADRSVDELDREMDKRK